MKTLLLSSALLIFVLGLVLIPSASALPVSYNTTAINLGLTSVPRNSSSYDVFPLIPDNWLWEKFDNNTIDSGPLSIPGTITYNTNLKALWKFENVLTDSSSSARTLTKAAGTTTYTTSAEEGSGLVLDGSTYFTASDGSLPTGTNPVSVTSWIQVTSFASSPAYFQYGTGGGTLFGLSFDTNGHVMFKNGSTTTQISTTGLSINTFYYLSVTYDGTNARVYINGSLDKTTAVTVNTSLGGASGLSLGALAGGSNKMTGKLDEFRVYSGTALTLQQHQALYMVGHYSQSHTFDGGEYVTLGTQGISNTSPFTISTWIKVPTVSGNPEFYSNYPSGNGILAFINTAYKLSFQYRWNNGANSATVTGVSTALSDNAWHYVAITYDGSSNTNGIKLYVDGNLDNTGSSNTISAFSLSLAPVIGIDQGLASDQLTGQLDNMKYYPYALSSSQITSDYNSISPISSGKQFMSWYNGKSGSSTLTQKIGSTKSSLTLSCTPDSTLKNMGTNNTKIYYTCPPSGNNAQVAHIDISSGTTTNDFVASNNPGSVNNMYVFPTITKMFIVVNNAAGTGHIVSKANGNVSANSMGTSVTATNQKVFQSTTGFKYNYNGSSTQTVTAVGCELYYSPTAKNQTIDNINCDISMPASMIRYWNGMLINNIGSYSTNATQQFLNSIDASAYKKLLSLPCTILVSETPCADFILTDLTQTDYFVVLTSTHVYYGNAQTALGKLNSNNYAFQSYDIITQGTTSAFEVQNPILQSLKLYGPINLNSTVSKAGLFTLPSGYSVKTTSIESAIRTIDPRWTNDATDIPIITSTSSLFPIYLTVSNAPVFSAIKVTNPYQLINSQEAVWAVAQLDSTRTVEFDLPSNVCVNVYVADISVSPSIWNFQGIICASGVNQKTISYTNTLPFTFWTYPWGASDSFTPNTNGLVTTVRHTTAPFSYNIVLKNSSGTVFQNTTYTSNSTIDTQSFNLTGRAKPVSLYISSVTGGVNQIYSAFLGSPISLANTASFFNQYFSYQGFNLLAFIPIIFASMFTRNTIGIGVVLTVLCIATLSWLSVVVIPELDIMIMIVIAIIGLIAYRLTYY